MSFRLPPLPAVRAFEAAARLLSVKAAAEELLLTPSAISHAVQTLEEWLGVDLFERSGRTLRLTDAGERLLPHLSKALTSLAAATSVMPGRSAERVLRLSVGTTIANRLLLPRIPPFMAKHPDLMLSIDTSHRRFDAPVEDVDAAIRIAELGDAAPDWVLLARERLVPVCSPALLAGLGKEGGAVSLQELPSSRISSVPREWELWSKAAQIPMVPKAAQITVDTIQLGFNCAEAGLGVVLGRRPLIDDALAAGTLVAVGTEVPASTALWLILAEGVIERPETRAFRHWITAELRDDVAKEQVDMRRPGRSA